MSGKRIWIIEDDGNRLVKFREVQPCWKSTSGQPVPVHLQLVPVHPCRRVAESNLYRYTFNLYRYTFNLYRYTFNLYRYTHAKKWQRATCTGTPVPAHLQPVPVHPCRKVAESNLYRYTTNLYQYTCVRTVGIEQEFDSNARACSSFNYQCGITMKRGIKAIGHKEKASFDS